MKKISLIALLAAFLLIGGWAEAKAVTSTKIVNATSTKAAVKTTKNCTTTQSKLSKVENEHKTDNERRVNSYLNLLDRLNKFVLRLKNNGLNTAKLESDIAQLKTKIDKFSVDYKAYLVAVADLNKNGCQKTDLQFKAKLKDLRTAFANIKEDGVVIKNFYATVIKKDLKDLKSQKNSNSTSTPVTPVTTTSSTSTISTSTSN